MTTLVTVTQHFVFVGLHAKLHSLDYVSFGNYMHFFNPVKYSFMNANVMCNHWDEPECAHSIVRLLYVLLYLPQISYFVMKHKPFMK